MQWGEVKHFRERPIMVHRKLLLFLAILALLPHSEAGAQGRGNGRAIANYIRSLKNANEPAPVIRRETERAQQLGTLLYGSGWAEGARRSGLGVALRHGLSFNQVRAVQYWTTNRICDVINPFLRAGRQLPKEHRYLDDQLRQALTHLPPYQAPTYRGTALRQSIVKQLKPGEVFVDNGFMSATKKKDIATQFVPPPKEGHQRVLFVINSRQGRDVSLVGWHGELREVLFPPGSRFTVVSAKKANGVLTVRLKDAPPELAAHRSH